MKAIQVSSLGSSHMEVIGVVGVAAIIWYGGSLVINGDMTPGAFFSFLDGDVHGLYADSPAVRLEQYHSTGVGGGGAGLQRHRSRNRAGDGSRAGWRCRRLRGQSSTKM